VNNAKKIACCGIFSALATVFLVVGAYTGFGMTAGFLASLCVLSNALAYKKSLWYTLICFCVSTVLACVFAPYYLQFLPYALLFAPLALTKVWVEDSKLSKTVGWIVKTLCFEVFFVAYLLVYRFLFFDDWQLFFTSPWLVILVVVLGQIAFVVYQIAFTKIFAWLKNLLDKILKKP